MDRSLKFFVDVANKTSVNNIDPITGLNMSTQNTQVTLNKYSNSNPLNYTAEQKSVNYSVVESQQNPGQFINYLGNSNTNDYLPHTSNPENESDIKLSSLIDWSKDHNALKLNSAQFAYLKNFNSYPANRLMILRRFDEAVPDNIFETTVSPISTMATYYDFSKSFLNISFSEDWVDFNSTFMSVLQDVIGINFISSTGNNTGKIGQVLSYLNDSPIATDLVHAIGRKLGILSEAVPYGDPNIVYDAKIRNASGNSNVLGDDKPNSGLNTNINITFEATYVQKEIKGIDSKAAMLDIIANITKMATSDAKFYITGSAKNQLNKIVDDLRTGNVDGLLNSIVSALQSVIAQIQASLKNAVNAVSTTSDTALSGEGVATAINALGSELKSIGAALIQTRYNRYKWQLKGAIGALSGMYTAPWHISIGNPKYPWFTMGNLYVKSCEMNLDGELGYNDMPTELTVKITLENGRPLGSDEIANLFNTGRGRIYDTPDKIQTLYIPEGTDTKLPGSVIQDTNGVDSNIPNDTITTDTDNDLAQSDVSTSDFALNNTEADKNLPQTTAEPATKFTYKTLTMGPKKKVEAYDTGNLVYSGNWSFSSTEQELIAEAKTAVGDV